MTRNEVLERLDAAGSDRGPIVYELVHVGLLRAAAELIRAGGWRPIADAPEGQSLIVGGYWLNGNADEATRPYVWIRESFQMEKDEAIEEHFTHYLPEPEPPAREVPNERG